MNSFIFLSLFSVAACSGFENSACDGLEAFPSRPSWPYQIILKAVDKDDEQVVQNCRQDTLPR
jgi:hypothetical protein